MLYFVLDEKKKLIKPGINTPQDSLTCPFCNLPVISFLDVHSSIVHAYHKGKTGCSPSTNDHLRYLFESKFPADCLLPIPGDEHLVPSANSEFPDYPGRFYSFPEQLISFSSSKVSVSPSSLKEIDYETKQVRIYEFIDTPIHIVFIFNFNREKFNKFSIPDEVLYNSSVIEYRFPDEPHPSNCQPDASIEQLVSLLEPIWIRNEKLMREIQKINNDRKDEVMKIAQTQSKNLLTLEREGILSIRRQT